MSAAAQSIGVLGTGKMGAPIARNLLTADFPVSVWNRTQERAAALVDEGARLSSSPAEAAKDADVVLTMMADGPAIEQVMCGGGEALESLRPGAVWIQMATIGLAWTERLAACAARLGVQFVDAPVSGSDGPARDGELVILAFGPRELRPRLDPIFDAIGRKSSGSTGPARGPGSSWS